MTTPENQLIEIFATKEFNQSIFKNYNSWKNTHSKEDKKMSYTKLYNLFNDVLSSYGFHLDKKTGRYYGDYLSFIVFPNIRHGKTIGDSAGIIRIEVTNSLENIKYMLLDKTSFFKCSYEYSTDSFV